MSVHVVDGGAVLFDRNTQSLYFANPTATLVWCLLGDGLSLDQTIDQVATRCSVDKDSAAALVSTAVGVWRGQGLLEGSTPSQRVSSLWQDEIEEERVPLGSLGVSMSCWCELLGTLFEIRFGTRRLYNLIGPTVRHLQSTPDVSSPVVVDVLEAEGGFIIAANGIVLARTPDLMEIAPMTLGQLFLLALRSSAAFCAIHASAVRHGNQTFLFIGASGAGKSTLAAALAASGFQHLADDTVSLDRDRLRIQPVPAPPCVKDGSWDVLREYYPDVAHMPTHRRPDGRALRYLEGIQRPPSAGPSQGEGPVTMVFVAYDPTRATEVRALSGAEALSNLLRHFYVLTDRLVPSDVDRLIDWVMGARRFSLSSASLKHGISAVRALCT